jgi:hypothetical protein
LNCTEKEAKQTNKKQAIAYKKVKNQQMLVRMQGKGMEIGLTTTEFIKNLKIEFLYALAMPLLGIYPKKLMPAY